MKASKK